MTATGTEDYVTEYSYSDSNGSYTALLQKEVKTIESDENPFTSETKQTVYTYDKNGNQIKKTADGKTETNTYDGLNQLIGFTDGTTTASYKYNASGLRYEKTVNGETVNHVWDGSKQIVADVIDNQFYEADCYIRGTNLVAKYNYCNGTKSEYTYYTQNAHGDVVNLTDKTGKVTKTYTYDAFGVEKNIDENDTNAFRYCGEYYDAETGTIYLRARYYDPSIGRFISRDSYVGKLNDPLSLNLYTYCHNNPICYVDPSGHFVCVGVDITINPGNYISVPNIGSIPNVGNTTIDFVGPMSYIDVSAKDWLKEDAIDEVDEKTKENDTKYYIYVLVDKHRNVQYVGQTVDLERRKKEHELSKNRGHLKFKAVNGMFFDNKLEARYAEQAGIEYFNTLNYVKPSRQTIQNPKLRQNNQRNEIGKFFYPLYEKTAKNVLTEMFKSFAEKYNYKPRK